MQSDELRNPVIVIPGILGSKLAQSETGRIVWGAFTPTVADPATADGAQLIALPMQVGSELRELTDDVVATGALDTIRVQLFGIPFQQRAYQQILGALGVRGYRDQQLSEAGAIDYGDRHFTCFQFAYDWRRDLVENAAELEAFIRERKRLVESELRERFGIERDVKFDIVAHSMGGLVARYLLRYGSQDLPLDGSLPKPTWAGKELIGRLLLVGTPNAGSADAIRQLVDGFQPAPLLPTYSQAILGTMPAIYQLLPRDRHGPLVSAADPAQRIERLFDVKFWEEARWGLADPARDADLQRLLPGVADAAERRRIALDHLAKCLERARRFHAAMDAPLVPPTGKEADLFAGDAMETVAVLAVDPATGRITNHSYAPGDVTVSRASALLDERVGGTWSPSLNSPIAWDRVQFLFRDHLGLTTDPSFTDNVLYSLLEDPTR